MDLRKTANSYSAFAAPPGYVEQAVRAHRLGDALAPPWPRGIFGPRRVRVRHPPLIAHHAALIHPNLGAQDLVGLRQGHLAARAHDPQSDPLPVGGRDDDAPRNFRRRDAPGDFRGRDAQWTQHRQNALLGEGVGRWGGCKPIGGFCVAN